MECNHEVVTALEANIIGVGYNALCLKCGNKVFVFTDRKHERETKINKLIIKGYPKETAEKMISNQYAMEDDTKRVESEKAAQIAEENRRRK